MSWHGPSITTYLIRDLGVAGQSAEGEQHPRHTTGPHDWVDYKIGFRNITGEF